MLRLSAILLLLLCSCDETLIGEETGQPVEYLAADVDQTKFNIIDVTVTVRNPDKRNDAARFSSCMAAGWAQDKGFLWVDRIRGNLHIDGVEHVNSVVYSVFRIDRPEGKEVFSAALTKGICEARGVPTNDSQLEDARGENNI